MENKIIITAPSKNIRLQARSILEGKWKTLSIALVIYLTIMELPVIIYESIVEYINPAFSDEVMDISEPNIEYLSLSAVSDIYVFVISGVFILGLAILSLNLVRGLSVNSFDIFSGFEYFIKSLGLFFMVSLFEFLWSLLFVVPGIIAYFRYSQAFFVLAENPEMNIMDCINKSKEMMHGNKKKLFCLNISFIGWIILAALPAGIFSGLMESFYVSQNLGFVVEFITFILSLTFAVLVSYMQTSSAVFYEMLNGKSFDKIDYSEGEVYY